MNDEDWNIEKYRKRKKKKKDLMILSPNKHWRKIFSSLVQGIVIEN